MKLKQLLIEANKIILDKKDMPDWVKPILGASFPTITVKVDEEPTIGGRFYDYDVMRTYFLVGDKGNKTRVEEKHAAHEDNYINADRGERALYHGVKVKLAPSIMENKPLMVLITHTHPKMAELFVHPENMPKVIDTDKKDDDLSKEEKAVIAITKGFISSYRKEYYKKYKINYEKVIEGLKQKGILSGNGALTTKGKNIALDLLGTTQSTTYLIKLFGNTEY